MTDHTPGLTLYGATFRHHAIDRLAVDNPRFDRHRFMRACGVEE